MTTLLPKKWLQSWIGARHTQQIWTILSFTHCLAITLDCIWLYRRSWYFLCSKYLPKMKCLYSTDCDIQLFSPSGVFENPTTSNTNHTCRILINAPPTVKIRIQALHIGFNSTNFQSTYIMVHTSILTLAGFFLICCILNRKKKRCSNCSTILSCSDPGHGCLKDQCV